MAKAYQIPAELIPEGFEDEAAFCKWIREEFQADIDADRFNREAALEDTEFLVGDQWDDEDLKAREGKPCLTINDLPQKVNQVTGDIRINRPGVKISPAEEADKAEAEIREGLIRQIERASDAQGVYVNAAEGQTIGGVGNFGIEIEYESARSFNRVLRLKAIPNPLAVVWDRMSVEKTGKDAGHVFVNDKLTKRAFDKAYPGALETNLTDDQRTSGWCDEGEVRVSKLYLMREDEVEIALLEDGSVVEVAELGDRVAVQRRMSAKRSCTIYLTNGHKILAEPTDWPVDRVPVIKVTANEVWVGDRRVRWGLIRFAKDPARLKNFWRSVSAEKLALAPKSQWLMPVGAANMNDDFRDAAENGDPVLPYDSRNEKPTRVDPAPIEAAVLNEAAMAAQDMKDVTGLHDASLGAKSNETSGRAIMARQREGDVATYVYGDNLKASIRAGGDVMNQLLPVVNDTKRIETILGKDEVAKAVAMNDPQNPESFSFGDSKYDVAVDTGPSFTTQRQEAAETLTSLAQSMPALGQAAPDLVVGTFDLPNGDQLVERLKRSLPPQLTQDPTQPQQPDPAQMQAMQMAQERAALELQEAKANARKAEADAVKAEAEAARALAEASMLGVNVDPTAPMPGGPPQPMPQQPQPAAPSEPAPMAPQPVPPEAMPPAPNFEQGPVSPDQLAPDQGFPAA